MNRLFLFRWVICSVVVALTSIAAAEEVDWTGGEICTPVWYIDPASPTTAEIINFAGPTTQVQSNDCFAEMFAGGSPTLIIDPQSKTIELWFQPPAPEICPTIWIPVCGLDGNFGPLAAGQWRFFGSSEGFPPVVDYFEINFTVVAEPVLTVLSPNGGENLLAGSTHTIRWESDGTIGQVLIEYSTDAGSSWNPVAPPNVGNSGSYDWLVPAVDSNQCLMRVSDAADPGTMDVSDDVFVIYQCQGPVFGDLNLDCYVNILDFALFAASWLDCGNPYDPSCSI